MRFFPKMTLGWLNGWIPLAIFYALFGIFLLGCSKGIVKKLYSVAGWSKREYFLSAIGKPFSLACIVLVTFSPLIYPMGFFFAGVICYLLGSAVMFISLFEYRQTPVDEPVIGGIYHFSRNPQWVGLVLIFAGTAIMAGNGLALCLFIVTLGLYHFRILGEERACLAAYGESYQRYLDAVPRYF